MSPRERRLRERIDTLTAERDWARARARKRGPTARLSRCVYCGAKTRTSKRPSVCRAHSDLPALDAAVS